MKRLFKKLARTFWLISAPVRRPVIRKFDHHMMQLLRPFSPPHPELPANLDLTLSSVVRELARLQIQVEILQQQIDDLQSSERDEARSESRLSVVGEIG
jgi:hypothetical protein